jgi:hypothetical protein
MYKRTRNEFIVAYFLARCGKKGRGKQPPELEVDSWTEAYQLFWPNLNGGRPRKQFSNSLKNLRDWFDGHLENGRVGWRASVSTGQVDDQAKPARLSRLGQEVFDEWEKRSDQELYDFVTEFIKREDQHSDWHSDLVSCIDLLDTEFKLSDIYDRFESQLSSFHPYNENIRPAIRRTLQELRELGAIVFIDNSGTYQKSDSFPVGIKIVDVLPGESTDPYSDLDDIPDDTDKRYSQSLRDRRGAPKFRRALMRLYDGKCAITGDEPAEVLEAAHIEPHAVSGRNSLDNGLLLRSDIHALFDDHLLWIEPDSLTVSIALKLRSTTYAGLEGQGLRPRIDGSVPNRQLLTDHMRNARTDA